ncbi:unnamed protein product [Symbiodinium necroappetens]|uniref:Uncharacterized protein n=1 Tax=Symbiodinium necroappetens TaxID=1628268 RepID=A0A812ZWU2_9DINO|nr:unnamed protein product [Symbiodinium necroappetens]
MSLPVSDEYALALGAAFLTALDQAMPQQSQREAWRLAHLTRWLRVTVACYDFRRFVGPFQSRQDLHVLTLATAVLSCVEASDTRMVELGQWASPSVVVMQQHMCFRAQIRMCCYLPLLQHTTGLRELFMPWGALLDDYALLIAGILAEPRSVADRL